MAQNTTSDARTDAQKIQMAEHFQAFEYEYREDDATDAEVVYEDDDVVVIADHTGHELNEWASDLDIDRSELSETMHELARQVCDYDWSVSDPVVFDKFEDDSDGEIESTLVFDVEHYDDYEPFERVAEGIHQRAGRKVKYIYDLDTETDETVLRLKTEYYLGDELKNESSGTAESYVLKDGVVQDNGQELQDFVRGNFDADPELALTDEFESMVN